LKHPSPPSKSVASNRPEMRGFPNIVISLYRIYQET
jgi:hypothetical protein